MILQIKENSQIANTTQHEFYVDQKTIKKQSKIKMDKKRKKVDADIMRLSLQKLKNNGVSMSKVALEIGTSDMTLSNILKGQEKIYSDLLDNFKKIPKYRKIYDESKRELAPVTILDTRTTSVEGEAFEAIKEWIIQNIWNAPSLADEGIHDKIKRLANSNQDSLRKLVNGKTNALQMNKVKQIAAANPAFRKAAILILEKYNDGLTITEQINLIHEGIESIKQLESDFKNKEVSSVILALTELKVKVKDEETKKLIDEKIEEFTLSLQKK